MNDDDDDDMEDGDDGDGLFCLALSRVPASPICFLFYIDRDNCKLCVSFYY